MGMREKKKPKKGRKPEVKPAEPWKGRMLEYDPKTLRLRYKGQKPDSELPNGRTVPAEHRLRDLILETWNGKNTDTEEVTREKIKIIEESMTADEKEGIISKIVSSLKDEGGEALKKHLDKSIEDASLGEILEARDKVLYGMPKRESEKISMADYDITPKFALDEKQRELARKIYTNGSDELIEEERAKVPFLSRLANGKEIIQKNKERVAKELGKDVADVTNEDIEKSLLAYWNFNSNPEPERVRWWGDEDSELSNGRTDPQEKLTERREPEKKKTHPERAKERFNDFMREKPKDPKDSS